MKALASDFDGTLFFPNQKPPVSEKDVIAIKDFQKNGHLFGFSTGRPLYGVLDYLNADIKADFYITNSGATIFDKDLNLLYEKTIPKEITDVLISYGVDHHYSVDFHMDGRFIAFGKSTCFITEEIYTLEEIQGHVHNITYDALSEEAAEELAKHINQLFEGKVSAYRNKQFVDIVPYGCSKGVGIELVRKALGIEYFAGIGDSMNDCSMLEKTDHAFTFPYAPQSLQQLSKQIVNSVAEAIKEIS